MYGLRKISVVGVMLLTAMLMPATPAQAAVISQAPAGYSCQPILAEPAQGSAVVAELGTEIAAVAADNGMSVPELKTELKDPSFWLDECGKAFYVEEEVTAPAEIGLPEAAPYAYDQTFLLHSKPGANRVIYLDFTGHTITGTGWNGYFPNSTTTYYFSPLSSDADEANFSNAEMDVIQTVWQMVAEDYAPFDVDVTTEEPIASDITRTDVNDVRYGTRAVITDDVPAQDACGCGGIAYVGVFDVTPASSHSYYQPALTFTDGLGGPLAAKAIAEATAHEVGHNVGLSHDGMGAAAYYSGANGWAPIMGVGYSQPLVQFSKGEYATPTNTEDDFTVMQANGLPLRTDDHANSSGAATALTSGTATGVISTATDTDWFSFTPTVTDSYTFNATAAPTSPNLDIQLQLYEGATLLQTNNPAFVRTSGTVASGLNASITATLTAGTTYFLVIDGTGYTSGATVYYTDYGSLGAYTLALSISVPGAPTSVSAVRGDTQATVSWTAPVSNGGSAITGYTVTSSPGSFTCTTATTSCTVTGLTNGTAYTFSVVATNIVGNSVASTASSAVTPAGLPTPPTTVSGTRGDSEVSVSWSGAGANGSAITGYTVTSSPGSFTCTSATSPCIVTGLTNGTAYTFTVAATNAVGTSNSSNPSAAVTPVAVPGKPTAVTATRGNTSADVSWTAGVNNGSPVTGYTVTSSPGSFTCTTTGATTCTVTGLTNGTAYTFTVVATNVDGNSIPSDPSNSVTPATVPNAPTAVSGTRGNTQVLVSWTAPSANGSAITGYEVTANPGGAVCTTTGATSCTVTGLTNGTAYTFTVTATNDVGTSSSSTASASVTPATVPGSPTAVSGTRGNASVVVSWTAPTDTGGSAITGYSVTSSPGSFTCSTTSATTCTVSGLTNGTAYTFTVRATNAVGSSLASTASAAVTPATVPTVPRTVTGVRGNAQVTVSWLAPTSNGGSAITGYTVTSTPGSFTCTTTGALSCTVTGLTNGTSYTFRVIATNEVGNSAQSTASAGVTPATVPGVPTSVTAVRGNTQATVSWTAPASTGGSAITGYTVTSTPGSLTCTTATTSCTVTGLTNGTSYTFVVVATNALGTGTASDPSAGVTPATVPGAPTSVSGTRGNASVAVSWTAPASDGGTAITGYTVTSTPGSLTCTTASTSCTVTGLTNGTSYTFRVVATNAVGNSAQSTASAAVVPATNPGAPTAVTATRGDTQVTVSWTAPASTGGSAVTGYTVTSNPGAFTCTTATTSCIVTGLTNGTAYTFTVIATNAVGDSTASTATSSVTPAGVPNAPTSVSAVAGNGQATVSWTASTDANGSAITGYTVTSTPGSFTCTTATTSCIVTGLTNGTSYTFVVRATNAVGNSAASTASTGVTPVGPPSAPTAVSGVRGNAQVTVSWTAPATNGGSAITGYTVTSNPGGFTCETSSTSCVVSGLTNGTAYTFTVTATNALGTSAASTASASVTPATNPGSPTNVSGTRGNAQVTVSWTAPASTGGSAVTGYTVTSSPGSFTCTTSTTSCIVTGLTNGTAYTFTVVATNAVGSSTASDPSSSVTPATTPGAPTAVSGVRGNTQVTVSWTAPASDGGSAITGYTVTSTPGSLTCTTSTTSCIVTGLTNGTSYTFRVVTTNAVGNSVQSTASAAVVPATTPGAPTAVTGVRGNNQVTVSWTAPASNGGSVITGYTVTSTPDSFTCTTATTSCTVTGLTNGTAYTFIVVATNAVGSSVASTASAAITPATNPGAPTAVTATAGNSQATVSWTAPVSDGGSVVTGYTVTSTPGSLTCTSATTSCIVTGLTNGTSYTFRVVATNAVGNSAQSTASSAVVPVGPPGAPTAVSGVRGNAQVTVSWTAPASTGGSAITGYTVTSTPGSFTCTSATTSCIVTGLTNGTSYTFTVTSTNAVGTSSASTASSAVIPATTPGAPTAVTGVRGNAQVTVSWTAPASNGGTAVTGYTVTSTPGSLTCTTAGTSCAVTGLTNGTSYTFTVVATNAVGNSSASTASAAVIPATTPGVPTAVTGVRGNTQVTVSWTAPASNGGSAITGYTVTSTPGSFTCTTATTSCIVTGLTNGTSYTFRVVATNDVGNSAQSTASAAVIPATTSGAPTAVAGVRGNAQVTVSWTAPVSSGGTAVTGYTVTSTPDSLTCTTAGTSCTVTGLTNGTSYTFTVVATNAVGNSSASTASAPVIPATTPGVPTAVLGVRGNTQVTVSWTAPASNGGSAITGYTVTSTPGSLTCTTETTSCIVTGLTNGTSYTFRVVATNAIGNSNQSTASAAVVPATTPSSPTAVQATRGNAQVTVSWTAPTSNGGTTVTGYTVTSTPGSLTCTTASTSCIVTGLTNGTSYTFTVIATNAVGDSTASVASSAVVPATVPDAPTDVVAERGNTSVQISWTAPASNGGSAITEYTVTSTSGSFTCTSATTSCIVNGLTNGTGYTFVVIAINAIGSSLASLASSETIPAAVPDSPSITSVTRGDEAATVSWSVPADNGNVVSSYTVTSSPDSLTCNTSSTSCDVEGLTNGVEYTFTVVATNSVGNSQKSAASLAVVPAGAPLAPTGVVVTRGNAQLTVSWAAADGNGDLVTGYTATATPGNATCTTTDATSCVIPGLVNGTSYVVTVTATNSVGTSTSSISSASVTPATKPSAPTVVKGLSLAIKKLRITISGMKANGAVITKHEYRFKLSTTTKWSAFKSVGVAKSWIVLGWLKGKTYNVQIRVTNSVGATISKTFNIRPTL